MLSFPDTKLPEDFTYLERKLDPGNDKPNTAFQNLARAKEAPRE